MRLLEACCTSPEEAAAAIAGGAGRIELCADIDVGGVTPCDGAIRATVALGVPVNVLVRPRGGDFVFSPEEEEEMAEAIARCRDLGAAGVVIGALRPDGSVDMEMMERLVRIARGDGSQRRLSVTFHRAFDECREPFSAFEDIIALGCDRLLTSGTAPTAWEGRELIAQLVEKASGRIIVMPGSGVTPENLASLEEETGAIEFHGTKICRRKI